MSAAGLDLAALSPALTRDASGIWTTRGDAGRMSFPMDGHADCFAVEDDSFWFAHRNECIARTLARFPFRGPFLDIGGGNGIVSQRLAADGIEPVVIEPGAEGAMNARKRGLTNVVCATLEQVAFGRSSFGGAGLFDVIEHVEDDVGLLSAVRDVLARHGVLCVTVPAYTWLWSAEDDLAGHFRRYTASRLRSVLEKSGFEVHYETYFFAPLTLPLFVFRTLRYRVLRQRVTSGASAAAQHAPHAAGRLAMDLCLRPERRLIEDGGSLPVGTSCLAVALAK